MFGDLRDKAARALEKIKSGDTERAKTFAGTAKRDEKDPDQGKYTSPPDEYPLVNAKGDTTPTSFHKSYLKTLEGYLEHKGLSIPKYVKNKDVTAYLKTRTSENKKGGTKMAKKHIMDLPTNVPRLQKGASMIADINKNGKIEGWEKARSDAIQRNQKKRAPR